MQKKISTIYKTLIWGGEISLAVADTTAVVQEAIARHNLSPVAAAALGRTLTATAYLCSWLKEEKSELSVSLDGGGAGGKIMAAGDGRLRVRGFLAHPSVVLPPRADGKLDVGAFVGKNGTLTVVRDDGGKPFVGTCALVSGEIAEDFSAYFFTSEQRPTAIALGVKVSPDGRCLGASGVFLQPLPGAEEGKILRAEEEIRSYASVSSLIEEGGAIPILKRFGAEKYDGREIVFACRCSRERAERALFSLGREQAEEILQEEGKINVHCHECNTDYTFGWEDINRIYKEKTR